MGLGVRGEAKITFLFEVQEMHCNPVKSHAVLNAKPMQSIMAYLCIIGCFGMAFSVRHGRHVVFVNNVVRPPC